MKRRENPLGAVLVQTRGDAEGGGHRRSGVAQERAWRLWGAFRGAVGGTVGVADGGGWLGGGRGGAKDAPADDNDAIVILLVPSEDARRGRAGALVHRVNRLLALTRRAEHPRHAELLVEMFELECVAETLQGRVPGEAEALLAIDRGVDAVDLADEGIQAGNVLVRGGGARCGVFGVVA